MKSGKYRHIFFCFLPLFLFVLLGLGIYGRGWWFLAPIIFLQIVVPLLDQVTGWQDDAQFEKSNFSPFVITLFNWNTRLYALLYMATTLWFAIHIRQFTSLEIGLLIGCCSLVGGICFAAAHELLHAKESIDQILQRITTAFLFYPHYKLIHVRSHHLNVGTDEDENTAWFNESIYAYLYRTIPGSAVRSWCIEARRFVANGKTAPGAAFRNKMFGYAVGQIVLLTALFLLAGPWGLLFYAAQIVGSHLVLESVNYIQHYGLLRHCQDGEYERTGAEHSWDTYHFFSSYVTYRVGHHSYHHLAVQPYYLLAVEPAAPKLPVGYFWSIPMVLLPPWWRRVINPKLKPATVAANSPG